MSEIQLQVRESIISKPERVDARGHMAADPKHYDTPKVNLGENIQRFDKKAKVYRENPYSYNAVSLKTKQTPITPTAEQMIANPLYNDVGKILGVDTVHDWGKSYDKVHRVVELAREKSNISDPQKLAQWIYRQINNAPSIGSSRLDDVYIYLRLGETNKPKPQAPKTIIKKVYVQAKPKVDNTKTFVNNWLKETLGGISGL